MSKLGEAYVQVRADLKGFNKDLDAQLKALTNKFEKTLSQDLGKRLGSNVGKGTSEGFKESTKALADDLQKELDRVGVGGGKSASKKFRKSFSDGMGEENQSFSSGLKRWLGSVVSVFEDGFSALPAELKAAIGVSLLGLVVPAGAFIGGAFAAATVLGVAGLGVALSTQFDEVRDRWTPFLNNLRDDLVTSASAFLPVVLDSLDEIELRMESILPTIKSIFDTTSKFVEPLTEGTINFVEGVLTGLNNGLEGLDFEGFTFALINGLTDLGVAIGDVFDEILSNPDADIALSDLLDTLVDIVDIGGEFINWSIDAWIVLRPVLDAVRDTTNALFDLSAAFTGFLLLNEDFTFDNIFAAFHEFDEEQTGRRIVRDFDNFGDALGGSVAATKKQEKALKELNRQLSDQDKLINDIISANVDYEESIDRVTQVYKDNKSATLDVRGEKGRDLVTGIQNEINKLGDYTKDRLKLGQLTEEQAQTFYNKEIKRIRAEHKARGGNIADFDRIFGLLITINGIPPTAPKLNNLAGSANAAEHALILAKNALTNLNNTPIKVRAPGQPVNIPHYADGGFISSPQIIGVGEGYKEEVVLPLTNPARSMKLLSQTPLAGMMGGSNVAVYIGNEQLNARMFRVAQGVNKQAARTMTQGPRMV